MSFPSLASINATYDYMTIGKAEERRQQLKMLIQYCHAKLKSLGQIQRPTAAAAVLRVPQGPSGSPIIPIFTRYPKDLAKHCQMFGFMIRPIVSPTVPSGQERIRICLHAANTTEQIDSLFREIEGWLGNLETTLDAERKERSQGGSTSELDLRVDLPENIKARL
jgi:8-amino-7-oxononanoate synthase